MTTITKPLSKEWIETQRGRAEFAAMVDTTTFIKALNALSECMRENELLKGCGGRSTLGTVEREMEKVQDNELP